MSRGAVVLVAILGLGLGWPAPAGATSCAGPPWGYTWDPLDQGAPALPVDVEPWELVGCDGDVPSIPACALIHDDGSVAVTVESVGEAACDSESVSYYGADHIRRYVPAEPLTPGTRYQLECTDDHGTYQRELRIRDDDEPAAPPPRLVVSRAHYSREDNGCCGYGDSIEFAFADADAGYLEEGGYVEVTYASGEVVVVQEHAFELPPVRETTTFVAVSASGERGEPAVVDGSEIKGDLVYIACAVERGSSPLAPWLLAAFAWVAAGVRRRRAG